MYRMYYVCLRPPPLRVNVCADDQYNPTLTDVLATVTNFATGGPVWICVGMFSLYHLYLAAGNSTTIEGWEKDKVATLIRRGKIREIKYPYVS
jgi:palmitoyltransferase